MRNKIFYTSFFLLSFFLLSSCGKAIEGDLIISNINIIDVETGKIDSGMDLIIIKDRIMSIVPHRKKLTYNAETIVDGTGKFLIPGLWDMHVHLSMIGKESIPLFVLNGVTGVRDMGGNWSELEEWRALGNLTEQNVYPKIKTAGPILESPQFYNLLQQILGPSYTNDRIAISSIEQAHIVVDSLSKMGADLIKVRTVKSQEIFKAIAAACKKNNIPFTGHIDQNIGIEFAIENKMQTIEHDLFLQSLSMDEKGLNKTLQTITDGRLNFTPTLLATYNSRLRSKDELIQLANDTLNRKTEFREYLSPKLIENWNIQLKIQALETPMKWDSLIIPLRSFAKSIAGKTTVLSGTDCGVPGIIPGKGLHQELKMLVEEMGLSNLQALQASTINAVRNLELQNEYGLVKSLYRADLLILNENPLEDISSSSNIFSIIRNGTILDQNEIKTRYNNLAADVRSSNEYYTPEILNHLREVLDNMNSGSK